MRSFIETSLRRFFETRPDLFGDDSEYLTFETAATYSGADGLNSTTVFGRIVYRRGTEKCISKSLCVKQMPQKIRFNSDAATAQIANEIFFYAHVLPVFNAYRNVDSLFAEFYDSCLRVTVAEKNAAIIFENLHESAFTLAHRHAFLDHEHLSLMLRKLGNFHAYSLKAKKEDPTRFRILCDLFAATFSVNYKKYTAFFTRLAKYGLGHLQRLPQYSRASSKIESIIDSAAEYVEQLFTGDKNSPMSVLCHGDYLRGNVMFRYENGKPTDMRMIDMANCALASPVVDLAQVLYLNADQRMRDEHWDDLIDEYYAGLGEYFSDIELPSRNDIVAQFEHKSFIGYLVASYFLQHSLSMDVCSAPYFHFLSPKYKTESFEDIPQDEIFLCMVNAVENSWTTQPLTDILRDMIDREFI